MPNGQIPSLAGPISGLAEALLSDNEERLRLALEAGRMGTWDWNVRTNDVAWSPTLEAIHGLATGSFNGTFAEFIDGVHPDDRATVRQAIGLTLEQGVEHHIEYRIHWPDGSIHWLEGRGRLFRDLEGDPLRMIGVCTDVTERKHADLALHESELRYRRLLGSVTDYIYTVKFEDGRPAETAHGLGCEGVTGYPPEAFRADPFLWFHMIAPEDRDAVKAQISCVEAGKEVASLEHRIIHKDGSVRWIRNTPVLRRDAAGRVTGYDGLISDISERKKAEEAVLHSNQQFEALVNSINGIVWECDVFSGRPTFVSQQALRLLGYPAERWLSEPGFWENRLHPDDRAATMEKFAQMSAAQPTQEVEYRLMAADGRAVWVHDLVRVVAENGRVVKQRGVMVDITNRKAAEEALQKNHVLMQAIIEGTTDAVFVKDLLGRYLMINTAGARFLGLSVEQVVGKDDTALFSPATARIIMERDRFTMATGEIQTYEDVGTAAGVTRTYLSTKGPYRDQNGNIIGLIGISRDITDRKLAECRQIAEHAVTRVLFESADLEAAAPRIFHAICEGLNWDLGTLWGVDHGAGGLRCLELWHDPSLEVIEFERLCWQLTFPLGVGLPGRVWSSGKPAWIANIVDDPNYPRWSFARKEGLHCVVAFPVHGGTEFLGVLEFFSRDSREPDEALQAMMANISIQISQFIERRAAERTLHQHERDVGLARQIQEGLLPRTAPILAGFDIGGASQPTQETGGDYFDFIPAGDQLGIAIGDASGHGIAAALLMAETRAYLRALAESHMDAGKILALVNLHLVEDIKRDWFVTLFLVFLDPRERTLVYSSAGHCTGYILDSKGEVKNLLRSSAMPLGIDPEVDYTAGQPVQLEPGDLLLLVTDGILDANPPNAPFGIARALALVSGLRDNPARDIVEALLQEVRDYCGTAPIDDMTAVVLKVVDGG